MLINEARGFDYRHISYNMILKKHPYWVLVILLFSLNTQAQYNFFIGEDADQLKTTIEGFGSISFPSIMINQSKIIGSPLSRYRPFYSVNFGFNWKQWRFPHNPAILRDDNGVIVVLPPPDWEVYEEGFINYTKSKFALGVIRIRPEIGITTHNKKFSVGTGPLFEFVLAAKHKRKFYYTGSKSKFEKTGVEYYNINTFQIGWGVSLGTYHVGVFSYVMLTPMFKEALGPRVYAAEVGLYWRILRENYEKYLPKNL